MPLSGFVQRCSECNDPAARAGRLPLSADGVVLGFVSPATSDLLLAFPDVFEGGNGGLRLSRALAGVEARTVAVDGVMRALHAAGHLRGWRGERLSVGPRFGETAFLLERSAAPLLGVRAYGVHVNCFVRDEGGGPPRVWVAKRAAGKGTWPGMWDHAVAGGQPHGISLADNVAKEAAEEAGVPEALARTAVPVGAVSYETVSPCGGFKRDVLFCFDLALPPGFVPVPVDGEVESFELWPAARLLAVVRDTRTVKPNCNLGAWVGWVGQALCARASPLTACSRTLFVFRFQ